jgi:hypothetical protein
MQTGNEKLGALDAVDFLDSNDDLALVMRLQAELEEEKERSSILQKALRDVSLESEERLKVIGRMQEENFDLKEQINDLEGSNDEHYRSQS